MRTVPALRWARLTWTGWLLAVPVIIVLALAGEALGIGGAQAIVGAGLGLTLGLAQARVVRGLLGSSAAWTCSHAIGLALPFLITDLARLAGVPVPYSLPAAVIAGGLIAGVWQWRLLRPHLSPAWTWVPASVAGWALAAGAVAAADALPRGGVVRGVGGALLYLAIVTGGGILLGLVTGVALARMRQERDG